MQPQPDASFDSHARRARRVTVLLAGVMVLSLADLIITLAHLRSTGMAEANPIAAYIIRTTHSPWVLAAYKAVTVGICVALLYRLRRAVTGEVAAWCAVVILTLMSLAWKHYSERMEIPDAVRVVDAADAHDWLQLD